jgi:cobalt-zinc-cadmium efflux system outer membrane protein
MRRADAEIRLARANRFEDVYVVFQPYTFRTRAPGVLGGTTSWAAGVTIPLPAYNRNQGNIQRAEVNATQTQLLLAAKEQEVVYDVKNRSGDVEITGQTVRDYRRVIMPAAKAILDTAEKDFKSDPNRLDALLEARGRFNEVARRYLDALIVNRRAALTLNTAVGRPVLCLDDRPALRGANDPPTTLCPNHPEARP